MAGNQAVVSFPTVPSPVGGVMYIVKTSDDYKVEVGGPLGLAYLDSSGNIPIELVSISWDDVTDKPTTFPPSSHTHTAADITSGTLALARIPNIPWANVTGVPVPATRWPTFAEVTNKPTTLAGYGITDFDPATKANTHNLTNESGYFTVRSYSTGTYGTGAMRSFYDANNRRWNLSSTEGNLTVTINGTGNEVYHAGNFPVTPFRSTSSYGGFKGTSATDANYSFSTSNTGSQTFLKGSSFVRLTGGTATWEVNNDGLTSSNNGFVSTGTGNAYTGFRWNGVFFREGASIYLRPNGSESSAGEVTVSTSGNVAANDFYATSDKRLKRDITKIEPRERLAELLEFVSFIWDNSGEDDLGVIAQQVQQVAPEYVHQKEDGYLSVNKGALALEVALGLASRVRELENKLGEK